MMPSTRWNLSPRFTSGENWPEAIAMRRDVLKLQVGVLGESHWKVTDARLAVQDVERRAAMKGENRRQLAEANRLEDEDMSRFYAAGRYSDAIEPARHRLRTPPRGSGRAHPDYAESLNYLASLLNLQSDFAAAKPLYERALTIRKEVLGERHPKYISSLNNLAFVLDRLGEHADAKSLYHRDGNM